MATLVETRRVAGVEHGLLSSHPVPYPRGAARAWQSLAGHATIRCVRPVLQFQAADAYGCRGDQACVKIAETTKCDRACQQACKKYRFDYVTCYSVWGPKFEFQREQQKRGIK